MTDEYREVQASLYALGALPAEEEREFEMALHSDLKLQLLLDELSAAADAMVVAFPRLDPPPALKHRILAAIDQRLTANNIPRNPGLAPMSSWQSWLAWAMTGAFGVLCVILIFLDQSFRQQNSGLIQQLSELKEQTTQLQTERDSLQTQVDQLSARYAQISSNFHQQVAERIDDLQRKKADLQKQFDQHSVDSQTQVSGLQSQIFKAAAEQDRLKQELAGAWASLKRDPFAQMRLLTLKPSADAPPKALAAAIWDLGQQKGLLGVEGLAVLPPSRTYQTWILDRKSPTAPINAGVFNVDEKGAARIQLNGLSAHVDDVSRVMISTERKGGAAAPTKVILSSN